MNVYFWSYVCAHDNTGWENALKNDTLIVIMIFSFQLIKILLNSQGQIKVKLYQKRTNLKPSNWYRMFTANACIMFRDFIIFSKSVNMFDSELSIQ